jgi:L-asparaginase / beta-aspartyl-peptidase
LVRGRVTPSLIAHGGAGAIGPAQERPERRRVLLAAVREGAKLLSAGRSALDAVVATVVALEEHPLFNAGFGSLLNSEGEVEMDASVMCAEPLAHLDGARPKHGARPTQEFRISAGAVAAVRRVRNPVMLARAVMEHTPHLLMAGPAAERFARRAGIALCPPETLVSARARERWRARQEQQVARAAAGHGTVGAAALDARGGLAAATSTGGVPGKLAGRVGDSAIIGAGTFATAIGAASATGQGEAIIFSALCREAVLALDGAPPERVARRAIAELIAAAGAEAGLVIVDRRGRIGYAHNAPMMEIAMFDDASGLRHERVAPIAPRAARDR